MDKTKKNLKTINEMLVPAEFSVVKKDGGSWYEYDILKNNKNVHSFIWKKPVHELFDAIASQSIKEINSLFYDKKETQENESVPVATAAHVAAAMKNNIVTMNKRNDVYISDMNAEIADISILQTKKKPGREFEGYYFPNFTDALVNRIKGNRKVFLTGEAGVGKSELIQKLADYYGQKLIRVNFSSGVTEGTLIGKYTVRAGETVFAYGFLPMAMKKGYWVLLDEIDYAQPEYLAIMQAVLEGKPLVITNNEGEIVEPHPNFRLFATGNTKGRGDLSDSYTGTNFLNMAFLDRWTIFEMTYTNKEQEIIFKISKDKELSEKIKKVFELFRTAQKEGTIVNSVFSTRRMIALVEALVMGDSLIEAFEYEIFSRYHEDESSILIEYVKDIFNEEFYLKKDWTLGMPHFVPLQTEQEKNITNAPAGSTV